MRKSKARSDDKKKASDDRNRIGEVLLAERLGLSDDWKDPDNIPDLPQAIPPVAGCNLSPGEAKEVEKQVTLLVAFGCQRPVLYWCLERLGPEADKVRKGQVKYLVPGDVKTKNPWATKTSAPQTREDMARFIALSKAYAKALQQAQNELLMVAEAQPDAHPLPWGFLTEEPDNAHEAMLSLRQLVAWARKLGEAYHAPNIGLLVKSKRDPILANLCMDPYEIPTRWRGSKRKGHQADQAVPDHPSGRGPDRNYRTGLRWHR
jgi:hypothetical protein